MGIPKEDARFVIPQSVKTTIVVTMMRGSYCTFLFEDVSKSTMGDKRSAALMLNEVKKVAPTIFEDAGPECISKGACPEGNVIVTKR